MVGVYWVRIDYLASASFWEGSLAGADSSWESGSRQGIKEHLEQRGRSVLITHSVNDSIMELGEGQPRVWIVGIRVGISVTEVCHESIFYQIEIHWAILC